ncbi:MAG: hypothetical protein SGCHY_003865 [Lobulomycetales sp.]
MKMYENLAHGVVTLVPTPRFLKQILSWPGYELSSIAETTSTGASWHEYIEFYSADLKGYYYTFDSLADLRRIVSSLDPIDTRNVRARGPVLWTAMRQTSLNAWREVFHDWTQLAPGTDYDDVHERAVRREAHAREAKARRDEVEKARRRGVVAWLFG